MQDRCDALGMIIRQEEIARLTACQLVLFAEVNMKPTPHCGAYTFHSVDNHYEKCTWERTQCQ